MLAALPSFAVALILALAFEAHAAPRPSSPAGQTIHLSRRSTTTRTYEEWGVWAREHKKGLLAKYGSTPAVSKRSSGTNLIVDQSADSVYYGSLAVGTPPVAFNVILDTGSSDLWVADQDCITGCGSVATFNPAASSTFNNLTTAFSITYGSGHASGVLAQDTIQMAGFSVSKQPFGVCNVISDGLLNKPVSGLMGLAFSTISSAGTTPFWETLAEGGAWDSPVMSFQLTRFKNQTATKTLEPGGTFTMGFVNDTLFTGDIDYQDIPGGKGTYWLLPITTLTVQGSAVTLPSGSASYAAIDTGTTLVGGPSAVIADLYAQIPGSSAGTGNYQGYYFYPCDTEVTVALAFGGQTWAISPDDFQQTALTPSQCLGAFFELDGSGDSTPAWIVGDTFLKNVYSVFRFNPPSVGFAALSEAADAFSEIGGTVPTATLGSVAAQVTATSRDTTGSSTSSGRSIKSRSSLGTLIFSVAATTVLGGMFVFVL